MPERYDVGASSDGFLKVSGKPGEALSSQDRATLIRRGNEFFNAGNLTAAKRVFVTVGYTDGLIRLGNHFSKHGDVLEAFRMYWLAGDRRRIDEMSEQFAGVIRRWLQEDE